MASNPTYSHEAFGLRQEDVASIKHILSASPKVKKVILFGSRATGNFRPGSDIDIAIEADDLTRDELMRLALQLEDLDLLYKIDLLDYTKISNSDLRAHIARVGKVL
jgi:predicted nucleotidyltransferase